VRIIGLMSGTSLDGVDAALVRFSGTDAASLSWRVEAVHEAAYPPDRRGRIQAVIEGATAEELCRLHADLGEWLAEAAQAVAARGGVALADVTLIGSHGQTVWHQPPEASRRGATLQLGCPATIAERTGVPVVSDFRGRDMAAGGQGAPLVPFADRLLFAAPGIRRVLVNVGGMANLTWVPARGDDTPLLAFDTGPGNVLIDAAVALASDGADLFDRDGGWGAEGEVDEELARELLRHPFFGRAPPKSTGRELFGRGMAEALAARRGPRDRTGWASLIATLTALTARSIARAIREWVLDRGVDEVVVTGGGARNRTILSMLRMELAPLPVVSGRERGIDVDAKEAVAFAALAWAFAHGMAGNIIEATGARGPRVLGSYTPGRHAVPIRFGTE
jgi:anhydro-N-acetylmuramic acid kinase